MPSPPSTNGLATCSLVCGIAGVLTGPLTGIPAIITGHLAQARIRKSGGMLPGAGPAVAGLILGYITTVASVMVIGLAALVTPVISRALERANLVENMNRAKRIQYALDGYAVDNGGGYPVDLSFLTTGSGGSFGGDFRYVLPKTKVLKDWIYFSGQSNRDPSTNLILAAPETLPHRKGRGRIVVFVDGSARVIPEAEE